MHVETIAADAATEARARFTIEARALFNAVKLLSGKVTEKRNSIPILSTLLIEASPCGRVTITATDLDIWATVTLSADPSEEIEPGALCLDAYALSQMLAKVSKNSDRVRIEAQDSNRAKLKAGRNEYKLPGLPRDDYPMHKAAEVDCAGLVDRAQFLADIKALAPAICTEESRYYLNGYALQVRELGGADRFAMVATDGRVIGAASRPIPAGLEGWADAILPRKLGAVMLAADKMAGEGDTATLSRFGALVAVEFGAVRIVSKLIDGTFPQWPLAFERIATPTGEVDPPMFPELLPGAPVADMEKLAKLAPGPVTWENGNGGLLGTVASDPGFLLACHRGPLSDTGRNGFTHHVGGHGEAAAYLKAIAEGLGLPSDAEMQARVDAINAAWGEPDTAAYNQERAHGAAAIAGGSIGYRQSPMQHAGLIQRSGRILGYTVGGFSLTHAWRETRPNWETLVHDVIEHPETVEVIEGSYSVLMPDHGPQLAVVPDHYVDAADGHRYPIADNGSKIHLSADQLRALIGDSVWTVLEFPGADGKPRYVSQWLWDDGATRLLCVGKDGRCPKGDAVREYVTRAEVEAALAGEAVTASMPQETAENASAAPVLVTSPITVAPEAVSAPEIAEERAEPVAMAADTPEAPASAPTPVSYQPADDSDPIAVVRARLAEIEALLATLPAQSAARPKRTPAHERAIRRAWAERKAARAMRFNLQLARDMAANNNRAAEFLRDKAEAAEAERDKSIALSEGRHATMMNALGEVNRLRDQVKLAESIAEDHLRMREDVQRILAATERRAEAAEAENAQLWAEIETLTAPVEALAA